MPVWHTRCLDVAVLRVMGRGGACARCGWRGDWVRTWSGEWVRTWRGRRDSPRSAARNASGQPRAGR